MNDNSSRRIAALQKYGVERFSAIPGKSYGENRLSQVRPNCTFQNFEIYSQEQRPIVARLQDLAEQIIRKRDLILRNEFPFDNGRIMFMTSPPGHGKTHLAEAVINHIAEKAPQLLSKVVLSRGSFYSDHQVGACDYGGAPIVIIDDIFADRQSIDQLHPRTDMQAFMSFITMLYERRIFALITSNFRLMGEDGGILGRLESCDQVGRVLSRCKQVLAASGEIVLPGRDFREELAQRHAGESFTL